MKIYVASDHRGVEIEQKLIAYLNNNNYKAFGPKLEHHDTDDYSDFAYEVAQNVLKNKENFGILICGTGIGMSIAANKIKGIMAARCCNKEEAFLARNHNFANILCFSSKISFEEMCEMIETFITSKPNEEQKYLRRINKIKDIEKGTYNGL